MDDFRGTSEKRLLAKHSISAIIWIVLVIFFLTGCVQNALNDATYNRYMELGNQAQQTGDYKVAYNIYQSLGREAQNVGKYIAAEEAYQQALTNIELGNLGSDKKSHMLYSIGTIKHIMGKLKEAEEFMLAALALEEEVYGSDHYTLGYTLGDLSILYIKQHKIDDGVMLLPRIESLYLKNPDKFTRQFKTAIKRVFKEYAAKLEELGRTLEAQHFQTVADQIVIPRK